MSKNPYTSHIFSSFLCCCEYFINLINNLLFYLEFFLVFLSNIRAFKCGTNLLKPLQLWLLRKLVLSNVGLIKRRILVFDSWYLILKSVLENKQEMVWEINDWVLWGYWLIIYMKSMLNCHIIVIEKRKGNRKRSKRVYQDRGTWKLKTLNDQEL